MDVDVGAIEKFRAKEAEYEGRVTDLSTATAERDEVCHDCTQSRQLFL